MRAYFELVCLSTTYKCSIIRALLADMTLGPSCINILITGSDAYRHITAGCSHFNKSIIKAVSL